MLAILSPLLCGDIFFLGILHVCSMSAQSFIQQVFMSSYSVAGTVLGAGLQQGKKQNRITSLATFPEGERDNKQVS